MIEVGFVEKTINRVFLMGCPAHTQHYDEHTDGETAVLTAGTGTHTHNIQYLKRRYAGVRVAGAA